jgi:cytochrome o ubiquinol oxidase subunit 2
MNNKLVARAWAGLQPMGAVACVGNCGGSHWALLDPMGPIGMDEKRLILTAFGLMLLVVIPVIVMTFLFARRYRASNTSATYSPKWDYSGKIEAVVWLVPTIIVLVLSILVWRESHALSPYRPIASNVKPVQVEAVSMDWKWLFIYPQLGIASVNKLVFPSGTPVSFRITSDTVMTSFFIPQLGSQIYAMAGMQTKLHLLADHPGTYRGINSQFSGNGFSGMHFDAVATTEQGFQDWVKEVKASNATLDDASLKKLEIPTENAPVQYFAAVRHGLFGDIIRKYNPEMVPMNTASNHGNANASNKGNGNSS